MPDRRTQLLAQFSPRTRYANFGPLIRAVTIRGFRGIADLRIQFDFPVTAISGLNGSGKSTVGQICLSGYRKPTTAHEYNRFYVRDFFPASVADPNPFHQNSSVIFEYETDDAEMPQELTVKRMAAEWSGYKRQPERKCIYVGFTIYIPKVERKDVSIYRGRDITLTNQRAIPLDVREKVGRILGQKYDELHFQGIRHREKMGELGVASRFGERYSENNMGFGEGRTLYLIDLLENSPEQSLFVIEEPETSLHEHAQYELAKYLLDVAYRRHHQIIVSTHSDCILRVLPPEGRLLLHRDANGVQGYPRLSSTRARALLSLGRERDLVVFVEDHFAKLLLSEMLRRSEPELLNAIQIEEIGNTDAVRNAVRLMERIGRNSMAVRDADIGPDEAHGIFSFPGIQPPERQVYGKPEIREFIRIEFGIDVENELALREVTNHHDITKALASAANTIPDYLMALAIRRFVELTDPADYLHLVDAIRARA